MIQEETFNLKFVAIHDLYQMKKKIDNNQLRSI